MGTGFMGGCHSEFHMDMSIGPGLASLMSTDSYGTL